jgi:hypothetical protein
MRVAARAVTGVCSAEWLGLPSEEHEASLLGAKGVWANWLLGFPLGEALKAFALFGVATGGWADPGELPADWQSAPALARMVALDGVGILLTLTLWRRWLLGWAGVR